MGSSRGYSMNELAASGGRLPKKTAGDVHRENLNNIVATQDAWGLTRNLPSGNPSIGDTVNAAAKRHADSLKSPDLTDMVMRNVERAERLRSKVGKTRASMFNEAAAPQKLPTIPPPTKKGA